MNPSSSIAALPRRRSSRLAEPSGARASTPRRPSGPAEGPRMVGAPPVASGVRSGRSSSGADGRIAFRAGAAADAGRQRPGEILPAQTPSRRPRRRRRRADPGAHPSGATRARRRAHADADADLRAGTPAARPTPPCPGTTAIAPPRTPRPDVSPPLLISRIQEVRREEGSRRSPSSLFACSSAARSRAALSRAGPARREAPAREPGLRSRARRSSAGADGREPLRARTRRRDPTEDTSGRPRQDRRDRRPCRTPGSDSARRAPRRPKAIRRDARGSRRLRRRRGPARRLPRKSRRRRRSGRRARRDSGRSRRGPPDPRHSGRSRLRSRDARCSEDPLPRRRGRAARQGRRPGRRRRLASGGAHRAPATTSASRSPATARSTGRDGRPTHVASVVVRGSAAGTRPRTSSRRTSRGVPFWLVTGPPIPEGRRRSTARASRRTRPKFIFFSLASLWAAQALGFQPDVVHAHDFHASRAPSTGSRPRAAANDFFRERRLGPHDPQPAVRRPGRRTRARRVPPADGRRGRRALPESHRDSLLALGLLAADEITTVSPDVRARDPDARSTGTASTGSCAPAPDRLTGILNGIDSRSGTRRPTKRSRSATTPTRRSRRARTRRPSRRRRASRGRGRPLLGVVSRLDWQKGLDIARARRPALARARRPVRAARHGRARLSSRSTRALELELSAAARACACGSTRAYARRIYAGADALADPLAVRALRPDADDRDALRGGPRRAADRAGSRTRSSTPAIPAGPESCSTRRRPAALWDALERMLRVYAQPARWAELQSARHAHRFLLEPLGGAIRRALRASARESSARATADAVSPMKTRAVILAGGEGSRLGVLTDKRAKPAVPFAGQVPDHRLHALQLRQLRRRGRDDPDAVPAALVERAHRRRAGPGTSTAASRAACRSTSRTAAAWSTDWYKGTADAITQNLSFVERGRARPRPRALRRPHLQDELRPAHPLPPRAQGGRHDRDAERDARRGDADGDPRDGSRRRRPRHAVRREARGPARARSRRWASTSSAARRSRRC